jgi:hypothetical protein
MAKKHITTIEGLAELIDEIMARQEDIKALEDRVHTRFDAVELRLDTLDARVGRIEADVHALRDEMVHRRECEDVRDRVTYTSGSSALRAGSHTHRAMRPSPEPPGPRIRTNKKPSDSHIGGSERPRCPYLASISPRRAARLLTFFSDPFHPQPLAT